MKISRICLALAVVCLALTLFSLYPDGQSSWGGAPWLLAHLLVVAALVALLGE